MKYVTTENYAINSYENAVFQADIDCDNLKGSTVNVCAELPSNWEWDPFKGCVYINLFNDTTNLNNVSLAPKAILYLTSVFLPSQY